MAVRRTKKVIYEFPCNERLRTCLRLETTISRMQYLISQDKPTAALAAFDVLFDIVELTSRPDLRKDLVQELQRVRAVIQNPEMRPRKINEQMAEEFTQRLVEAIDGLTKALPGYRSMQALRDCDWLNTVKARSQMPGGNCSFDHPSLHHWLSRPFEQRRAQFLEWLEGTATIKKAVEVILAVHRATSEFRTVEATNGSVSLPVPPHCGWSLIQIAIVADQTFIPEVTVNKFLLWVHFLEMTEQMRTPPSRANITFELSLCGI